VLRLNARARGNNTSKCEGAFVGAKADQATGAYMKAGGDSKKYYLEEPSLASKYRSYCGGGVRGGGRSIAEAWRNGNCFRSKVGKSI